MIGRPLIVTPFGQGLGAGDRHHPALVVRAVARDVDDPAGGVDAALAEELHGEVDRARDRGALGATHRLGRHLLGEIRKRSRGRRGRSTARSPAGPRSRPIRSRRPRSCRAGRAGSRRGPGASGRHRRSLAAAARARPCPSSRRCRPRSRGRGRPRYRRGPALRATIANRIARLASARRMTERSMSVSSIAAMSPASEPPAIGGRSHFSGAAARSAPARP